MQLLRTLYTKKIKAVVGACLGVGVDGRDNLESAWRRCSCSVDVLANGSEVCCSSDWCTSSSFVYGWNCLALHLTTSSVLGKFDSPTVQVEGNEFQSAHAVLVKKTVEEP